jgi:hypothetical protein
MNDQAAQPSVYTLLVSLAFMVWMLVDAWRRRAPLHWYFIIVVMPFGAVFYFVMVKLRDFRDGAAQPFVGPTARASSTSLAPPATQPVDLNLADTWEEREQYADAEPLYRAAIAADPANKRALHGLGRCLLGSGNAKESLVHFEKLLELDREFANFGAALDYADALWAAGQQSDTLELLEALCATTHRLNHRLALCHYLAESGHGERAKRELEQALANATGPTAPFNERHRQWVTRGRQMLAELYERFPENPDGAQ